MSKKEYKLLEEYEHVLQNLSLYLGIADTGLVETTEIYKNIDGEIIEENFTFCEGLYVLSNEIITNAFDQYIETGKNQVKNIIIKFDDNMLSVQNDGPSIPIKKFNKKIDGKELYIPEVIFTKLKSGSSFGDENTVRYKAGKHGYGVKLVNFCSKKMDIEIVDNGLTYKQKFTNNMKQKRIDVSEPVITKTPKLNDKVFVRFYLNDKIWQEGFGPDFCKKLNQRIWHLSALSEKNLKFTLDCKIIKYVYNKYNFLNFIKDIIGDDEYKTFKYFECNQNNFIWKIGVRVVKNQPDYLFVNGVKIEKGGNQEYIYNLLSDKILSMVNRGSGEKITVKQLRNLFQIFICLYMDKPQFPKQSKDELANKASFFKQKKSLNVEEFTKIVIDPIRKTKQFKEFIEIEKMKSEVDLGKKSEKKASKQSLLGIKKLDDANKAGTKDWDKCHLFICEGDSAKNFVLSGFKVINRDYYGVYPLKGKPINVRQNKVKSLQNKEFLDLVKIIGLTSDNITKGKLRYGNVIFIADQDTDGFHIIALLLNMFQYFWKEIIQCNNKGLLKLLRFYTPIIKITYTSKGSNKKMEKMFFTIVEFNEWKNKHKNTKIQKAKYYKGLGTSTNEEVVKYFKNFDNYLLNICYDPKKDDKMIEMAFKKDPAERKEWITAYDEKNIQELISKKTVNFTEIINNEYILHSVYNILTKIPSIVDGLKIVQRKILYTVFLSNKDTEFKVIQLTGRVMEKTSYGHGDSSLNNAIIGMAQNFVGTNNINYLLPLGQYGSRFGSRQSGDNLGASSPRYISTKLNPLILKIFRKEDDIILQHKIDDEGHNIEPYYYYPIIPMVLVNGIIGIATGFSNDIAAYNPIDLVNIIENMIKNDGKIVGKFSIKPFYKNYKGPINVVSGKTAETRSSVILTGIVEKITGKDEYRITEIPIGLEGKYKTNVLSKLVENKTISSKIVIKSTDTDVDIRIKLIDKSVLKTKKIEEVLQLSNKWGSASNFAINNENEQIEIFRTVKEVIKTFYEIRYDAYDERKTLYTKELKRELEEIDERRRFIQMVIDKKIIVFKRTKENLKQQLKENNFVHIDKLIQIPIYLFTKDEVDKLNKLYNEKNTIYQNYKKTTIESLWLTELNELKNLL